MLDFMRSLMELLVETVGWQNAIYIKDLVIFASGGIFLGTVVFLLSAYFFLNIHKIEELPKYLLKIDYMDREVVFADPTTLRESVDLLFTCILMTLNPKKRHHFKDTRREKIIINVVIIVMIVVFAFGLYLVANILPIPQLYQ